MDTEITMLPARFVRFDYDEKGEKKVVLDLNCLNK